MTDTQDIIPLTDEEFETVTAKLQTVETELDGFVKNPPEFIVSYTTRVEHLKKEQKRLREIIKITMKTWKSPKANLGNGTKLEVIVSKRAPKNVDLEELQLVLLNFFLQEEYIPDNVEQNVYNIMEALRETLVTQIIHSLRVTKPK